jgi:flagellar biosynthesis/type III secretory pathway protein FliH
MDAHAAQDFWEEQDEESLQEDIDREWKYRREEFRKSGLREGYEAGKQETVQQGFDQGESLRLSIVRIPTARWL